tara:strand:+ start:57514 stop:58287 length:774 start_codon:yes stop_codon:yes gene_type:complete
LNNKWFFTHIISTIFRLLGFQQSIKISNFHILVKKSILYCIFEPNTIILNIPELKALLNISDTKIAEDILLSSNKLTIDKSTLVLSEGENVRQIPLVVSGVIKVYTTYEDRDLLLYYIEKGQSCIMSVNAILNNENSKVNAVCETDVTALLLPAKSLKQLYSNYPDFHSLILSWYNSRYLELLHTIQHLIFDKLDIRVLEHLKTKQKVLQQEVLKITHQQIAQELGTVREVISRVLKKLENQGEIKLTKNGIIILHR